MKIFLKYWLGTLCSFLALALVVSVFKYLISWICSQSNTIQFLIIFFCATTVVSIFVYLFFETGFFDSYEDDPDFWDEDPEWEEEELDSSYSLSEPDKSEDKDLE